MTLLKTRGQDKKVVPQSWQQKWKTKEEILETDLPTDFTTIKATSCHPYMVIQSTEKNMQPCILAFRVPILSRFIQQLRNSHSLLSTRENKIQTTRNIYQLPLRPVGSLFSYTLHVQ